MRWWPWTARAWRAMSRDIISRELALVDCMGAEGAVDQGFEHIGVRTVGEVEHGRLGEAAAEFVGAGDDQVRALGQGVGGDVGVEAEVGGPGLVDDEQDAVLVGDLGEGGDVGDRAKVAGGDQVGGDGFGVGVEGGGQGSGRRP